MKMKLIILFLIMVGLLVGSTAAAEACPRPTPMTAPDVGPWFHFAHGPTYERIEVHFTLHDQFGDRESPLYLYRAADRVWRTTANPASQPTTCREQYQQLIDFSLSVLNEGERPFTYDNHDAVAAYEAFLLSKHDWLVWLPLVVKR